VSLIGNSVFMTLFPSLTSTSCSLFLDEKLISSHIATHLVVVVVVVVVVVRATYSKSLRLRLFKLDRNEI